MAKFAAIFVAMLAAMTCPEPNGRIAAQENKEAEPKLLEPTDEQLAAAKEAYAKHGATYSFMKHSAAKKVVLTTHLFDMPRATDADLKGLPDLPFYFALNLSGSKVTDAGLKEVKKLKNLTMLGLAETKATSDGMKEIKDLKNLRHLNLEYTQVTDSGLRELKGLENLKELILRNPYVGSLRRLTETPVTDAGVAELQRALPKCYIGYK
jgi:internalin A